MKYDHHRNQESEARRAVPGEQVCRACGSVAVSQEIDIQTTEPIQHDMSRTSGYRIRTVRVMGVGFAPKKTKVDSYGLIALAKSKKSQRQND